jgi:hypothetical protein
MDQPGDVFGQPPSLGLPGTRLGRGRTGGRVVIPGDVGFDLGLMRVCHDWSPGWVNSTGWGEAQQKTPPEGGVGGTAGGSAAGQGLLVRARPCLAVEGGAGWPIIS